MRMTRRRLLAAAGGAAAVLSAPAVGRARTRPYAGQPLTVFTYAGAYETTLRKYMIPNF